MSLITVEGLKKSFGEVKALDGVDLEVDEGEIIGVLGPNGAGKSTLIQILTGQLQPDNGEIEVFGLDPSENSVEAREKMGILPEREDPPSFLTGLEYFDFISDVRDAEIDSEAWIQRLNLEGKMEKHTRKLSKGERQKLMVAQAFFHDPEMVFIDEPLVNLDPVVQEEAKKIFQEYTEDGGTVFLCTHVISLAEEVCDRVVFLKDGKVTDEVTDMENLKQKFLDSQ